MASELLTDQRNFLTLESLKKGFSTISLHSPWKPKYKFKIFHGFFFISLSIIYEIWNFVKQWNSTFPKILKINKIFSKILNFNVLKTF